MAVSLERVQQFFDDPPAAGGGGFPFTIAGFTNVSVIGTGAVSFSLNTTGIGLLVVSESYVQLNGLTDADPHDGVNTYTPLNGIGSSGGLATNQIFYVVNPTGGNITISATHNTTTLCAEWYSVSGGTAALDQQAPGGSVANTQPSVSPGNIVNADDRLFITGVSAIVGAGFNTPPIDSSFIATSATNVVASGGFSAGMAHKRSSTDENPNWSFQATAFAGSTMANFKVGGGGGFSLVAHTSKGGNTTTVTTDPIDTSGATLLIALGGYYSGSVTFTDSKGNTWTPLTLQGSGTLFTQVYWCVPTSVGSGHTFHFDAAFPGLCVMAFYGANASPFDLQDGNSGVGGATTIQAAGAINPSVDGSLVVSAVAVGLNDFTTTVDSGLTVIEYVQNTSGGAGNHLNFGLGYLIQSPHASINPTWTISTGSTTTRSTSLSSFKPQ